MRGGYPQPVWILYSNVRDVRYKVNKWSNKPSYRTSKRRNLSPRDEGETPLLAFKYCTSLRTEPLNVHKMLTTAGEHFMYYIERITYNEIEGKMSGNLSSLDNALNNLEATFNKVQGDRASLINKMKMVVDNIILNPNEDSPRMTEVKLATIKTLDDMLRSAESSATTMAKTQLQKKNDESSESTKQMVVEMLKNINITIGANSGGVKIPSANIATAIETAVEKTNHPISDDELSVPEVPLNK